MCQWYHQKKIWVLKIGGGSFGFPNCTSDHLASAATATIPIILMAKDLEADMEKIMAIGKIL